MSINPKKPTGKPTGFKSISRSLELSPDDMRMFDNGLREGVNGVLLLARHYGYVSEEKHGQPAQYLYDTEDLLPEEVSYIIHQIKTRLIRG